MLFVFLTFPTSNLFLRFGSENIFFFPNKIGLFKVENFNGPFGAMGGKTGL